MHEFSPFLFDRKFRFIVFTDFFYDFWVCMCISFYCCEGFKSKMHTYTILFLHRLMSREKETNNSYYSFPCEEFRCSFFASFYLIDYVINLNLEHSKHMTILVVFLSVPDFRTLVCLHKSFGWMWWKKDNLFGFTWLFWSAQFLNFFSLMIQYKVEANFGTSKVFCKSKTYSEHCTIRCASRKMCIFVCNSMCNLMRTLLIKTFSFKLCFWSFETFGASWLTFAKIYLIHLLFRLMKPLFISSEGRKRTSKCSLTRIARQNWFKNCCQIFS